MRKAVLIAVISIAVLAGCASQQQRELTAWSEQNWAMAKAGQIQWSDYYTQLFDKVAALPSGNGKGDVMNLAAQMLEAARLYEAGKLTTAEFEQAQRVAQANLQRIDDGLADRRRSAWVAGFNSMGNTFQQNAQMYQQRANQHIYTPSVTCDSRSLSGGVQTVCR